NYLIKNSSLYIVNDIAILENKLLPQKEDTMGQANIIIRTDSQLKAKAKSVLDDIGCDMSTAIEQFLKEVVQRRGIPFEISKSDEKEKNIEEKV
ncbi:MAG: type II toxin-antitoxin system RelB/DinJ family antitoxin, partial [Syntrophobacterales bacterium]|nr:type II toxin-antitoxin system RelB/DinJ family antitoxin [Syntrophobacterales bacterium]